MPPQRQKHISQKVGTVVTVPAGACAAWARPWIGDHCDAAAVAPKVAAETVRKRRRERCGMA
jgi:hypothetical protein